MSCVRFRIESIHDVCCLRFGNALKMRREDSECRGNISHLLYIMCYVYV